MSNHCNAKCLSSTGASQADLERELERCNREIERLYREAETEPNTTGIMMGLRDWQYEKRLIEAELAS